MQPKYELTLRNPKQTPPQVLECDGPTGDVSVNYAPRTMLPPLSFEEFKSLPDHDKHPRYTHPENTRHSSASRIGRLLKNSWDEDSISHSHLLEIMARFEILFPGSVQGIRSSRN